MREILFRGKRVDNGEWVEGYFLEKYSTFLGKIMPFIKIATKSKNVLAAIIVKRETVGQYTGLTDKNGKKIFEGDIIQDKLDDAPELEYMVMFDKGSFIAKCLSVDYEDIHLDEFLSFGEFDAIVIGNIHDKSEWLEGVSQ